jgi:gamma-glutamylcyclotransferase (GGCT)/AIG2-like uncharacterized protein YtfP
MANRKQKEKEIKYYFAYGSNMNHQHMKMRCPKSEYVDTFELPEYELVFRSVADVQQSKDKSVSGALFTITEECERSLDRYEGYPNLYIKKYYNNWSDQLDRFVPQRIMFYSMVDKNIVYPPSESYLETIVRGYIDCDLPIQPLEEAVNYSATRLDI